MSADAGELLLAVPAAFLIKLLWNLLREWPIQEGPASEPETAEERAKVLDMLGQGAITSADAAELLDALGERRRPGDALPVEPGLISVLVGALAVTAGFVLPWGHVRMGNMTGYQAGYHVGLLGWLILVLGLVPAILACIPALNNVVRQGLLRLVIASPGPVLSGALVIRAFALRGLPGIGLWLVVLGFAVQIIGGLAQSRAGARRSEKVPQ
jgi:hypothetical protein